jgi:hypothetical protein
MNKLLLFTVQGILLAGSIFAQSAKEDKGQQIILTNTSNIDLTDKAISIKRGSLHVPKGTVYPLLLSSPNDTIPVQKDDVDGDNNWDELFFVVNIRAHGKKACTLHWVTRQPVFVIRTSVRFGKRASATTPVQPATSETVYKNELPKSLGYQRYQTDGPSWENDKVGFRHYLDGRNAKDVFGKRAAYMSPENVGINAAGAVEDNYHVMADWGRDILAVGNSVGIGGIALLKGDSILRLGVTVNDSVNNVEKTTFKIVSEGPVRSIMNIKYYGWKPADRSYNAEETISIWPGMYAYHNLVNVTGVKGNENLAIGMVNLNSDKQPVEIRTGSKWVALVLHDKHTYKKEWWLGLALIVPADAYLGYTEAPKKGKLTNSFLARMKLTERPVEYFAVAGWELSDPGFKDAGYFQRYVENLVQQLSAEVTVSIK